MPESPLPSGEEVKLAQEIPCPQCGKGRITITKTIYKFPRTNEHTCFLLFRCDRCDYRQNDVIPLDTEFRPGTFTLTVRPGDLTAKIFRSATAAISIPELDVEIEPGPAAAFMLTNVEGVLARLQQFARLLLPDCEDPGKVERTLAAIQDILEGKRGVTLILQDLEGGSYIAPPDPALLVYEALPPRQD